MITFHRTHIPFRNVLVVVTARGDRTTKTVLRSLIVDLLQYVGPEEFVGATNAIHTVLEHLDISTWEPLQCESQPGYSSKKLATASHGFG